MNIIQSLARKKKNVLKDDERLMRKMSAFGKRDSRRSETQTTVLHPFFHLNHTCHLQIHLQGFYSCTWSQNEWCNVRHRGLESLCKKTKHWNIVSELDPFCQMHVIYDVRSFIHLKTTWLLQYLLQTKRTTAAFTLHYNASCIY